MKYYATEYLNKSTAILERKLNEKRHIFVEICQATNKGYGLTSEDIRKRTHLSLVRVRDILRELREQKRIKFYADWYGNRMGYRRCYVLEEKKGAENGR